VFDAFDVLIEGGIVVDGTGAPRRRADVGVRGTLIVAIGDLKGAKAHATVDARGQIVAPGFIDAHAHDDAALLNPQLQWPKLSQGITTVINGNCGLSVAPLVARQVPAPLDLLGSDVFQHPTFAAYLHAVGEARPAINAACLVGHTTLRVACMADLSRSATPDECAAMRAKLCEALDAGAIGASIGLYYPPAQAATVAEVLSVCEPLTATGGVIAAHIRDEGDAVIDALNEALDIGKALCVRTVISHHKLIGAANHGRSRETLALLAQRSRLQPVCLDCYPYNASSTMLSVERAVSAKRVLVSQSDTHPEASGKDLDEVALGWGLDRRAAVEQLMPGRAIYFSMDERDVRSILSFPHTMIGSDGLPHDAVPHPRLWGAFPRVLGHYARDLQLLDLETAVHRMTGLTAQNFGLRDRGRLQLGMAADITVFNEARVADRSTFEQPNQASDGISLVVVNGCIAVCDGIATGARMGQVLTRRARSPTRLVA
jgi:N-acyl-D-amino-acid deacylase